MKEQIENIEKVFIVSRRKSKRVKPDEIWLEDFQTNVLAVFRCRQHAQHYIDYWECADDIFDILERKLG